MFRLLVGEFYHNPNIQKRNVFFFFPFHFALSSAMDEPLLDDSDHGNCYGALFLCCHLKERTQGPELGRHGHGKPEACNMAKRNKIYTNKKMMFPEFKV